MTDIDFAFTQENLKVFIPIAGTLTGFIIFWFVQSSEKVKQRYLKKHGNDKGSARFYIQTRYLGAISMGVLPAFAFFIAFPETKFSDLGISMPGANWPKTVLWIIGLGTLMATMAYFSAKNPKNLEKYPQIRAKKWSKKMVWSNLASWAGYLLGYEFLFRGVLFFPLVEAIGLWPAIAVNIGMYSSTHIPHGLGQTIGAIPLSIVLCLLTISTGNIWIAFFVHVAMAWTNTTVSLKHHPHMEVT